MLCATDIWRVTGFVEGDPFAARRRFCALAEMLALRFLPSETALALTLARPLIPASGAMTPLEARSMWLSVACALSGVAAGNCWLSGPAVPSAVREPPPGIWALSLKGE